MADTGNGATLVMGTSGFTASYFSIGGFEQERPVMDSSDLATTGFNKKEAGDLVEPGEFTAEFIYDADDQPPISGTAETITLTYPSGATAAGTGFVSKWSAPELVNDDLQKASLTVQWDGGTGPAYVDA